MARFFLHLHEGGGAGVDNEGVDLPDLACARARAIDGIRGCLGHDAMAGALDMRGRVEIADRQGRVLMIVPFADALAITVA